MTRACAAIATFFTYHSDLLKHNDPKKQSIHWKLNKYNQNIAFVIDCGE